MIARRAASWARRGAGRARALSGLTHVDEGGGRPRMVDVSGKAVTARSATAEARVLLPPEVARALEQRGAAGRDLTGPKGPVLSTAVVAGTMAVKKTPELIPFCHPLPVEGCRFEAEVEACSEEERGRGFGAAVRIACEVRVTHKTGVEMEALTGATVAALTVYDMCKALSHRIEIASARLVRKRGGKSDV